MALADDRINANRTDRVTVEADAAALFAELNVAGMGKEELASHVYALFTMGAKASKAIAAQYLAERLEARVKEGAFTAQTLKDSLPPYLVAAIEFVTPVPDRVAGAESGEGTAALAEAATVAEAMAQEGEAAAVEAEPDGV